MGHLDATGGQINDALQGIANHSLAQEYRCQKVEVILSDNPSLLMKESGIFVTSIDVFFRSKDDSLPVTVQLRSTKLGLPTSEIYPFSEVVLDPNQIVTSENASLPTKITF